jgi:hypothetical protein
LDIAFTGDVHGATITLMSNLIIARKLQSIPSNMHLVTNCDLVNDPRILNFKSTYALVKELRDIHSVLNRPGSQALFVKPSYTNNKKQDNRNNKPNSRSQKTGKLPPPKTPIRTKTNDSKRAPLDEFRKEATRRLNPLFFPTGRWFYTPFSIGDVFFRKNYYLDVLSLCFNEELEVHASNSIIMKCLYQLGIICHSGSGIKSSASKDVYERYPIDSVPYQKVYTFIEKRMPDMERNLNELIADFQSRLKYGKVYKGDDLPLEDFEM